MAHTSHCRGLYACGAAMLALPVLFRNLAEIREREGYGPRTVTLLLQNLILEPAQIHHRTPPAPGVRALQI
jgi:hypothetical protein